MTLALLWLLLSLQSLRLSSSIHTVTSVPLQQQQQEQEQFILPKSVVVNTTAKQEIAQDKEESETEEEREEKEDATNKEDDSPQKEQEKEQNDEEDASNDVGAIATKEEEEKEEEEPFDFAEWHNEVHSGIIGSPTSTTVMLPMPNDHDKDEDCQCNLVSTDCLHTLDCLIRNQNEDYYNPHQQQDRIYQGILLRQALRTPSPDGTTSNVAAPFNYSDVKYDAAPIGKSIQSLSFTLFRQWMQNGVLPQQVVMDERPEGKDKTDIDERFVLPVFVNASLYPFCVEHELWGKDCFLGNFNNATEALGDLEQAALAAARSEAGQQQQDRNNENSSVEQQLQQFRTQPWNATTLDYLMVFAQMSKVAFHIRPHLMEKYHEQVRTIPANATMATTTTTTTTTTKQPTPVPTFCISLHLRRGDACDHKMDPRQYAAAPSPLDSHAQVSGERLCYRTAVYMKALSRVVQQITNDGQQAVDVQVHLATDHQESLIAEIRRHFPRLFAKVTWKYVEYPQDWFTYGEKIEREAERYIESAHTAPFLGESAMLDVHHLSYGQVFIGHMGSRFGKLSWWQMLARYNQFVPFFTVDGHSICCDIDEPCGKVAPAIVSMENCLTFSAMDRDREFFGQIPDVYWSEGSFVRFAAAMDEIVHRRRERGERPVDAHEPAANDEPIPEAYSITNALTVARQNYIVDMFFNMTKRGRRVAERNKQQTIGSRKR